MSPLTRRFLAGSTAAAGHPLAARSGAPHALHADDRPSYRREAAEDGWSRLLDWFRRHGAA